MARDPIDSLERFLDAQDSVLPQVRAQLLEGDKRSHWMWFIFPQIAGLGASPTARHYAITGLGEAIEYLRHPTLGPRLEECTRLLLAWGGKRSCVSILGPVDALKFCSSMTLFEQAATNRMDAPWFGQAIEAFCRGQRDGKTLDLLERQRS